MSVVIMTSSKELRIEITAQCPGKTSMNDTGTYEVPVPLFKVIKIVLNSS